MTLPSALFGLVCALLLGALFHLFVDGGGGRLILYLALSAVGFAGGHWLAVALGWSVLPIGPLELGVAAPGSIIVLLVGHWLSLIRIESTTDDDTV